MNTLFLVPWWLNYFIRFCSFVKQVFGFTLVRLFAFVLQFTKLYSFQTITSTPSNTRSPTRRSTRAGIGFKPLNMVHTRPGHLWRWASELHWPMTKEIEFIKMIVRYTIQSIPELTQPKYILETEVNATSLIRRIWEIQNDELIDLKEWDAKRLSTQQK